MTTNDRTAIINDRYEIYRRIGRGGMADVFLGRDRLLDRQVAIKVLFPEFAVDPNFVERFRREAQAAANLSHPNIVTLYDMGEDERFGLFLVFLYAPTIVLIVFSFNDSVIAALPFVGFTTRWYEAAWQEEGVRDALWASVKVAIGSALIATGLGLLVSYAIARRRFGGKAAISALVLVPLVLLILAIALYPQFALERSEKTVTSLSSPSPTAAAAAAAEALPGGTPYAPLEETP